MPGSVNSPRSGICVLSLLAVLLLAACDNVLVPFPTPPVPGPTSTPAVSGDELPPNGTPATTEAPPCSADDVTAVAGWQNVNGVMVGAVSLTNTGEASCALEGRPGIHLLDVEGKLMPVANLEQKPGSGASASGHVLLRAGEKAFVRFIWNNWCGGELGPYRLAVALPGTGGQLTVPGLDPEGNALTSAPRCASSDVSSTITVNGFEK